MNFIAVLAIVSAFGLFSFLIGWNLAVHRFRTKQKSLDREIKLVQDQVLILETAFAEDPNRAAVNSGMIFVISQIRAGLDQLEAQTR